MEHSIAVLYSSKYGHAKQYALWAAEELHCPVLDYDQSKPQDWTSYPTILFFSGLYVGRPRRLEALLKESTDQKIIVGIVGLTDPQEQRHTMDTIEQSLPAERRNNTPLFYLHGGLTYKSLSFFERLAIGAMVSGVSKKEAKTETDLVLIQSKETPVNFMNKEALQPILECLR